ncbi:hypothetical protein KSF78_0003706 [Schistosoma japonicum]|nr:hypothetical protein KSF78_0003706 [Schistosoma japonicum]
MINSFLSDALQAGASQFEASAVWVVSEQKNKAEHDETSSHSRLMSNSSHSLPEPVMIVENSGRGKPALPYPIMQLTEPGDEAPFFDSSRINSNRSEKLHSPSSLSSQSSSAFSSFPQSQHHFKNNDTFLF